jgi:hypothetical protein
MHSIAEYRNKGFQRIRVSLTNGRGFVSRAAAIAVNVLDASLIKLVSGSIFCLYHGISMFRRPVNLFQTIPFHLFKLERLQLTLLVPHPT